MNALGWIILIVVAAAILVALAAWFYERATNEVSLVRTGIGGRKVVIDGGTLAIPFFHEISRVNMQTIRMDVARTGDQSLITKDRMRIDVGAEFYASVVPEEAAIVRAAQTLGRRTFQPDQLKSLIDGMMVDALRAVAAQMTMDELHENRSEFVREVHEALADTLTKYGLQLDSVSLTALDQTPFASLDENNAFNAVGMRKLAEVIAKSKRERAEIEGDTAVAVRRAEVEASQRRLQIELEERRAEIAQTQEIEMLLATQLTEVARRKAEAEREAAQARIRMEQEIQSASIQRELAIREAEIAQLRTVEMAEQDKTIQLSAKGRRYRRTHRPDQGRRGYKDAQGTGRGRAAQEAGPCRRAAGRRGQRGPCPYHRRGGSGGGQGQRRHPARGSGLDEGLQAGRGRGRRRPHQGREQPIRCRYGARGRAHPAGEAAGHCQRDGQTRREDQGHQHQPYHGA